MGIAKFFRKAEVRQVRFTQKITTSVRPMQKVTLATPRIQRSHVDRPEADQLNVRLGEWHYNAFPTQTGLVMSKVKCDESIN